ncbi:MAG TPA: hypothetical protein VMD09_05290 [Solirubrobacteraceae bacterium]|nr:hypothetical protein [Solirubrobacteraceae bacterium]
MALLGWLWLISPFALIGLISHDSELQRGVATHLTQARVAGCLGAVMMFLGASVIPGALGATMYALGTPLTGLLAFIRRDDRDDGGEDAPDDPPVDWDEFERSFRTHARRQPSSPRRPRSPSAV